MTIPTWSLSSRQNGDRLGAGYFVVLHGALSAEDHAAWTTTPRPFETIFCSSPTTAALIAEFFNQRSTTAAQPAVAATVTPAVTEAGLRVATGCTFPAPPDLRLPSAPRDGAEA